MRRLSARPELDRTTRRKLVAKTKAIKTAEDPKSAAKRIYKASREAKWFETVTSLLKSVAGPGERCMFCSGSESSQVEHFQPKAIFPKLAMSWSNFLWVCGICNLHKGDRFPPKTEPGGQLINPIEEDAWDYFYIDQFGHLTPKWNKDINDVDPRAASTAEILKLSDPEVRQGLIDSRRERRRDLVKQVKRSIQGYEQGTLTRDDLEQELAEWKLQPFQLDVADYFLNGPGRDEEPFKAFFTIMNAPAS